MPMLTVSQSIAASGQLNVLDNWNYEFPPKDALFEVLVNGSAVGLTMNLTTGAESIVPAGSPVSSGGTAGVLPARLNVEPIVDMVAAGEKLVLLINNTTGGAITVNVVAILTYK